ncbi:MAG: GntG family PLP-dependent aldolase, partial [Dehalococcoidia bacterium]
WSHIFLNEVGGASVLGGVVYHTLQNDERGMLDPDEVEASIRGGNIHHPPTTLVCLENTHNRCSGTVLTPVDTEAIAQVAHRHGLALHLDGARIFNAAVYLELPPKELAREADSVCFSLSKALCAPVGSMLCGTREFVEQARKWRKMVGGGMRQVGVVAAAGLVALEQMIPRLAEDHANARRLAQGFARIPSLGIDPERIQTNIVIFEVPLGVSAAEFIQRLEAVGIRITPAGGRRVRMVTHQMITGEDVDEALNRVEAVVKELLQHVSQG